jgi:hypothetical protein
MSIDGEVMSRRNLARFAKAKLQELINRGNPKTQGRIKNHIKGREQNGTDQEFF